MRHTHFAIKKSMHSLNFEKRFLSGGNKVKEKKNTLQGSIKSNGLERPENPWLNKGEKCIGLFFFVDD